MAEAPAAKPPALTVAMVAGESRARAVGTLAKIAAQERADEIEVIVVDLAPELGQMPSPSGPGSVRVISAAPGSSFGAARALAVREASAAAIAFVEDHCPPAPGWAAALIEGHRHSRAAAIGYSFREAADRSYAARSTLVAEYGEWMEPAPGGATKTLPGNNVSYKREPLLEPGRDGRLDQFLAIDALLHADLLADGHELRVEPAALVHHESLPTLRSSLAANHSYSTLLAATQVALRGWRLPRRVAYALAAPLAAPILRLTRLIGRLGARRVLLGANLLLLPGCLAVYVWAALGQARGYLTGAGNAAAELRDWELAAKRR